MKYESRTIKAARKYFILHTLYFILFHSEGTGIRTQDLRLKRPLLYLLSYTPGFIPKNAGLPAVNSDN